MNKLTWLQSQLLPNEDPYLAVTRLNMPGLVDNPAPQGNVPAPVTVTDLLELCKDENEFPIAETQTYQNAVEAYNSGNKVDAMNYFSVLIKSGLIDEESAQKIQAKLAETIPDPSWQPQVMMSPAQVAGFGVVTVLDVMDVMDAMG
jgi:hypothetical protein